jgi:hypothetical protein
LVAKDNQNAVQSQKRSALEEIEGFCTDTVSLLYSSMFSTWVAAYFHPAETYEAEKKNASWGSIALQVALITIITGIVSSIVNTVTFLQMPGGMDLPMIGIIAVIGGVIGFVGFFLVSLIYLAVAKALGGKGGYKNQSLGIALVSGGMVLLAAPLQVLGAIPCLGIIFLLVAFAFGLYGLYSHYKMIKAVHGLSDMRTVGVIAISWAIMFVIWLVIVVVLSVAFLGALGLGAMAGGY